MNHDRAPRASETGFESQLRRRLSAAAAAIEVTEYVPRSVRRQQARRRSQRVGVWLGAAAAAAMLVGVVAVSRGGSDDDGRVGVAADPPIGAAGWESTTTSSVSSSSSTTVSSLEQAGPAQGVPGAAGDVGVAGSEVPTRRPAAGADVVSSDAGEVSSTSSTSTSIPSTSSTSSTASSSGCASGEPPRTSFVAPVDDTTDYSALSSISRSLASLGPVRTSYPFSTTTSLPTTTTVSCDAE